LCCSDKTGTGKTAENGRDILWVVIYDLNGGREQWLLQDSRGGKEAWEAPGLSQVLSRDK
jgi:hypothetical protein